jgi:predicted enzyme related to lactoylglutathione lyase
MSVPARVSFVTLCARDVPRLAAFYRALGWPESKHNAEDFAAFQCGGAVLGIHGAVNYETRYGPPPAEGSFRGIVLAINCRTPGEVDGIHRTLAGVEGAALCGPPADLPFGGRGFEFRDPEGNVWEVVWAEGTSFDDREGLIFP